MAKLIVHNPPRAILKASGYTGSPEGNIELTENNKTYDVSDFATATTSIPEPPEPTGTITLDENNRSYDVTDYAAADVAIPEEEKIVTPSTTRQEITPDNGLLSKVTVLPAPLEERTVTPAIVQQEITPEAPAIGFSKVTVGAASQPTLITKQITENGTYAAADDNADGYSEVAVEVDINQKLDTYIQGDLTSISTNVTKIANYLFYYNSFVQNINMPNVVEIGIHAFEYSNINISELPATLTTLESNAFAYTSNVRITAIPNGVTSIPQKCFLNASGIENIILPQNLTTINHQGFANCTNLQTVDLSFVNGIIVLSRGTGFSNTTCMFLFRDQTQLDEYAAATNWSALADRFQIKGATS